MRRGDQRWRLAIAQVQGVAAGYAGGHRGALPRDVALAEIAAISADPAVLADAAAVYLAAEHSDWYAGAAVDLLTEAGADPQLIEQFAAERRARRGRSLLGAVVDAHNKPDGQPSGS